MCHCQYDCRCRQDLLSWCVIYNCCHQDCPCIIRKDVICLRPIDCLKTFHYCQVFCYRFKSSIIASSLQLSLQVIIYRFKTFRFKSSDMYFRGIEDVVVIVLYWLLLVKMCLLCMCIDVLSMEEHFMWYISTWVNSSSFIIVTYGHLIWYFIDLDILFDITVNFYSTSWTFDINFYI